MSTRPINLFEYESLAKQKLFQMALDYSDFSRHLCGATPHTAHTSHTPLSHLTTVAYWSCCETS
ncbi:MAG: hypothetical protein QNJ54_10760 [Prochloraceae cyanobacterium]|nr:hypothetical protein [Prochloraceae cyanobacterium]